MTVAARAAAEDTGVAPSAFDAVLLAQRPENGSPLLNVTADKTSRGLASCGFDEDGVKDMEWPIVCEGILVDLQTARPRTSAGAAPARPGVLVRNIMMGAAFL